MPAGSMLLRVYVCMHVQRFLYVAIGSVKIVSADVYIEMAKIWMRAVAFITWSLG